MDQSEKKYELFVGQLVAIVIAGILISVGSGFLLGYKFGYEKGISATTVETPAYCSVNRVGDKNIVKCNDLGNVGLDNLCMWASPELKEKIKLVIIT